MSESIFESQTRPGDKPEKEVSDRVSIGSENKEHWVKRDGVLELDESKIDEKMKSVIAKATIKRIQEGIRDFEVQEKRAKKEERDRMMEELFNRARKLLELKKEYNELCKKLESPMHFLRFLVNPIMVTKEINRYHQVLDEHKKLFEEWYQLEYQLEESLTTEEALGFEAKLKDIFGPEEFDKLAK